MKKFKQLTLKQRYQISAYKEAGYTQKYIANLLNIAESTISRELRRNSIDGVYIPEDAEVLSYKRHSQKHKHIKLTNKVKNYIKKKLKEDWSPEQTDFAQVKRKQIRFIQDRLNNRPRKSLGFKTPAQVFYARVSKVMAA